MPSRLTGAMSYIETTARSKKQGNNRCESYRFTIGTRAAQAVELELKETDDPHQPDDPGRGR